MPLVATEIKSKFQSRIHDGLRRVFQADVSEGKEYDAVADAQWAKIADAISDIAMDLVTEIQTNAQVLPGQQVLTAGSPTTQSGTTISPGKIA